MRARGGFEVDLHWENGKLAAATLYSLTCGDCAVKYGDRPIRLELKAGETRRLDAGLRTRR